MSLDSEIDALTHSHVYLGKRHDENARRTLWVVLLTAVMMVGEIVAGIAFNSMALLADGFHMATHAGALGIAALAYRYAKRHATSGRYSFGTGKVGDLAGFASALVLGIVAIGIAWESAIRLVDPSPVEFGEATVIAVIGLGVNIASALLLGHGHDHEDHHGHAHDHRHEKDNNLRSAYLHVVADALTSVLAIAALLGGRYLGWVWLDPAMGVVGAIVIAVWSWSLMRDTGAVLLDATDDKLASEIRTLVEGPGDATITDLHVWRVGPGAHAAIVSVTGQGRAIICERLRPVHEIEHLTVEIR
ncbi:MULTISPECIES: CDF family Co(II)/Ni(II) efflux transporter DmeF [unclassified Sphingopyxis]|uniref:CDF family Co(II)/Ni(II) efflux transporter DmeF n=1 Tax=unclassified Sphingopyxis TaxID=2614943 RepID=UPI000730EA22|nr:MULTISPECIES: CDF family Co(II)/Ni(II) efflux transporter DmeF [unclassified Sphingopyxis]KTE28126.1 cation transporter [Sphingopyxis sp. H057]KTE55494.1 cation transporter [Sphingopyxis sp. H073]KTE57619.1 cation transporter [Sphingopyxis sp. H071]KTE61148.1 cation transporter [Sphingopyxis sp. H107]KTE66381.1 cation transporter [Sphingopyxis sp. H100]